MKILKRHIEDPFKAALQPNKVLVLLGPRRVGKTVLLEKFMEGLDQPLLFMSGEDLLTQQALERRSITHYQQLIGDHKLLIIDEAQKIPEVGKVLKLMVDHIKGLAIIATGSSAFDLEQHTGEPLTGRKKTFYLFPFSELEYGQVEPNWQKPEYLSQRLVYGNYPELIHLPDNAARAEYLQEMVSSYLLKDILAFDGLRNANKIFRLLQLVAFQVGNEISYHELATQLGISRNTVEKYLDLLSKVFILHRLGGFSRNLRKEVTKNSKWYFYDNGIRNAIIANLTPLDLRNDVGQLWENYIVSERMKKQAYEKMLVYNFFWRTYDQQEIDWIEDRGGKLYAYEFKWNERKKVSPPIAWRKAYPASAFQVIHPGNYLPWLQEQETLY